MRNIVIIHFMPLELYPPIQNFIRFLEKKAVAKQVYILSTRNQSSGVNEFVSHSSHIKIVRVGKPDKKSNAVTRTINYAVFYVGCLWKLITKKPSAILYFETMSSFPAYIYKRFFNSKVKVMVHYHEYTAPEEYNDSMVLNKFFYRYEKWIYARTTWVSHTNAWRMKQFMHDISPVSIAGQAHILPNYPPANWKHSSKEKIILPLKVIYAGALSMKTMFTKEFAEWVVRQNGLVIWDIYSLNITSDAKAFLESISSEWISLKKGVDYAALPEVLQKYDVGVILYKGHIDNYVYNAPNKLFEYWACGLDIWFPKIMTGSLPYITQGVYPKVMAVDFEDLSKLDLSSAIDRSGLSYSPSAFYAEDTFNELADYVFSNR